MNSIGSVGGPYFTYALFDDAGVVRYIGASRDAERVRRHVVDAHSKRPSQVRSNPQFKAWLRDMQARFGEIPFVVIHEGLSEAEAHAFEIALVDAVGRQCDGSGPLLNIARGGKGPLGVSLSEERLTKLVEANRGKVHTAETRLKRSEARRKLSPYYAPRDHVIITVLVENPHRPGTRNEELFRCLRCGMTVGEYLGGAGRSATYLRRAIRDGHICVGPTDHRSND